MVTNENERDLLGLTRALEPPCAPVTVYMVSWNARNGMYSSSIKRVAKAFINEDDAKAYKNLLLKAKAILQDTDDIDIKIEAQS